MQVEHREDGSVVTEATVKVRVRGERVIATAEGNGPVNALDEALRVALTKHYPELATFELADYKVRILEGSHGTGAVTRVLVRHHRRRCGLDHRRGPRERRRGQLARAGGRAQLRPVPAARAGLSGLTALARLTGSAHPGRAGQPAGGSTISAKIAWWSVRGTANTAYRATPTRRSASTWSMVTGGIGGWA